MTEQPMEGIPTQQQEKEKLLEELKDMRDNPPDRDKEYYTKDEVKNIVEKLTIEILTEVKNMAYGLNDIKHMRIGMDVVIEATEKMIKECGSK